MRWRRGAGCTGVWYMGLQLSKAHLAAMHEQWVITHWLINSDQVLRVSKCGIALRGSIRGTLCERVFGPFDTAVGGSSEASA